MGVIMALGQLVEGQWVSKREQEDTTGRFLRPSTTFRDRIIAEGSSGFKAESGRYHLYVSWACPWAQRTAIIKNS
jgi:putative glutathione S-transferase